MIVPSKIYRRLYYYEHIRGDQEFTEIIHILSELPSPKSQLLNALISNLELDPNLIRIMLCPTNSGKGLGIEVRNEIADLLQKKGDVLFPKNRGSVGSLIHSDSSQKKSRRNI